MFRYDLMINGIHTISSAKKYYFDKSLSPT